MSCMFMLRAENCLQRGLVWSKVIWSTNAFNLPCEISFAIFNTEVNLIANFVQQQDAAAELMSPPCEEKDLRRSCTGLHQCTITDLRSQQCLLCRTWLDGFICLLRVGSCIVLCCYKSAFWSLCLDCPAHWVTGQRRMIQAQVNRFSSSYFSTYSQKFLSRVYCLKVLIPAVLAVSPKAT